LLYPPKQRASNCVIKMLSQFNLQLKSGGCLFVVE
jgi:hypothetical protein